MGSRSGDPKVPERQGSVSMTLPLRLSYDVLRGAAGRTTRRVGFFPPGGRRFHRQDPVFVRVSGRSVVREPFGYTSSGVTTWAPRTSDHNFCGQLLSTTTVDLVTGTILESSIYTTRHLCVPLLPDSHLFLRIYPVFVLTEHFVPISKMSTSSPLLRSSNPTTCRFTGQTTPAAGTLNKEP